MKRYNPSEIEPKWQQIWAETNLYQTEELPGRENYYCLVMFPYPSGDVHAGHWYNFGPADTVARFHRMLGQNVLHPIGFDAFGLPAENAAIKRSIPPAKWTDQNIASMTKQFKAMGPMYDWERVVDTSKPEYYRWTQWLFLLLYKNGLAYRAKGWQNWCPKDQTVLANEQVVGENNVCERCGTPVIKKELEEWFFKITDYADRLLADLGEVVWPERVKSMQENWIGRSDGALIKFAVDGSKDEIEVFTTRPDTLFGATYVVLAPEHPLVAKATTAKQKKNVEDYVKSAARETELDRMEAKIKTGVFTGAYATNPASQEKVPIWVADYVLMSYGTGAIMAVPAHDERDSEFAKDFKLPIRRVVEPKFTANEGDSAVRPGEEFVKREAICAVVRNPKNDKYLCISWKKHPMNGLVTGGLEDGEDPVQAALREIREETGYKQIRFVDDPGIYIHSLFYHRQKKQNRWARFHFLFFELESEEREPIDASEAALLDVVWKSKPELEQFFSVIEGKFIVNLLNNPDYIYTGEGPLVNSGKFDGLVGTAAKGTIVEYLFKQKRARSETKYKLRDWLISRQRYWGTPIPIIYCDKCGIVPVPEDKLPVELPLDVEFAPTGKSPLADRPDFYETKCPNCDGPARRETDTMDTFVDSSWYYLRYPNNHYEAAAWDPEAVGRWLPVDQYIGGVEHAILHLLYSRFVTKVLYDQKLVKFKEPFKRLYNQGIILGPDGQKMSKSRGNVVNPDDWVAKFGADTFRMYLMFMGPYDQGGPFDTLGIVGLNRFLNRVWALAQEIIGATSSAERANTELATALIRLSHRTIKKVTHDLGNFSFNTAVAALMEHVNELYKLKVDLPFDADQTVWRDNLGILLRLLAPFAPHIAEELWHDLDDGASVHRQAWPQYREDLVREDLIEIPVQINGKFKLTFIYAAAAAEGEQLEAGARAAAAELLKGKTIVKTIVVPRKLVNFVVK